jgi:hypothetical protein
MKALNIGFVEYKQQMKNDNVNFHNIFNDDPNNTYLMQHAIIRKLLKNNNYIVASEDSDKSMFYFFRKLCPDDVKSCLIDKLLLINDPNKIYGIKLISMQHNLINSSYPDKIDDLFKNIETIEKKFNTYYF